MPRWTSSIRLADAWSFASSSALNFCFTILLIPCAFKTHGKERKTSLSIPWMPLTKVETALTVLEFLKMAEARSAQLNPMAHEVYPFNLMTSYAALTTSLWHSTQFSWSPSKPACALISRNRMPAMFTPDQTGTELSPCSPIIQPCMLVGATFKRCASKKRNRDESKFVPDPMTRFWGNPDNFQATL